MGRRRHSRSGRRSGRRHLSCREFRARGQRSRRSGSHGRDLLRRGQDPPGRGVGQIAGLCFRHRQRRFGRARGPDRPDRLLLRLDPGSADPDEFGAADRSDRCRCRRRDRGDIQHANRRRPVRNRTDAPRGQRQHVSPRRSRDRDRDLYRADFFRDPPILSGAANRGPAVGAGVGGADHRALHRAWRDRRSGRRSLIPAGSTHSRIGSTVFPTTICAIALAWPSSAF